MGYVFQNPDRQIFAEIVAEEVAFGPRNFGLGSEAVDESVRRALAACGLAGRETSDPFSLTKGERQRVAVASILAAGPRILILDEPTTGLDHTGQCTMLELLAALNREGHTIIIVTHALWSAAAHASRCVTLVDGVIVRDAPTRAFFADDAGLTEARLRAPGIVRLGLDVLGAPTLTEDEFLALASIP